MPSTSKETPKEIEQQRTTSATPVLKKRKTTHFNDLVTTITERKTRKNEISNTELENSRKAFEIKQQILNIELSMKKNEEEHQKQLFAMELQIKANELECSKIQLALASQQRNIS